MSSEDLGAALQEALASLPDDRGASVVALAQARDKAAMEGRPEWAALWALLAAELAAVGAARGREWREYVSDHGLSHIPFRLGELGNGGGR